MNDDKLVVATSINSEVTVYRECKEDDEAFGVSCMHIVKTVDGPTTIMKYMNAMQIVSMLKKMGYAVPDHFDFVEGCI